MFNILPAISTRKVGDFFPFGSGNTKIYTIPLRNRYLGLKVDVRKI